MQGYARHFPVSGSFFLRYCICVLVFLMLDLRFVRAEDFFVTNSSSSGAGSLAQALIDVQQTADSANKIIFSPELSLISLAENLPSLSLYPGTSLIIEGNDVVIDGGGGHRGLQIFSGDVTILNMTLQNVDLKSSGGADPPGKALFVGGGASIIAQNLILRDTQHDENREDIFSESLMFVADGGKFEMQGAMSMQKHSDIVLSGSGTLLFSSSAGEEQHIASEIFDASAVLSGNTGGALHASCVTYCVSQFGNWNLLKKGEGALFLSGDNHYSGETLVEQGTLFLDGTIRSPVRVFSEGMLGGNGTILGSLFLEPGATVSPGHSIGTLYTTGDVTFSQNSSYIVEVSSAGSDQIITTGSVFLNGGDVDVRVLEPGCFVASPCAILVGQSGISGQFSQVINTQNPFVFLTPQVSYDAEHAFLTLVRNALPYAFVAQTNNQRSVGYALQDLSLSYPLSPDWDTIFSALNSLTPEQAQKAFDEIGGVSLTFLQDTQALFMKNFGDLLLQRMAQVSVFAPQEGGYASSAAHFSNGIDVFPTSASAQQKTVTSGFWMRGYEGHTALSADKNALGFETTGQGAALGFDFRVTPHITLGFAGAWAGYDLSTDKDRATGTVDAHAFAAYAQYNAEHLRVVGGAEYGFLDNALTRQIDFGRISRLAKSTYQSVSKRVYGEIGYRLDRLFNLEPFVGFNYADFDMPAYRETGAGALNLDIPAQNVYGMMTLLGARWSYPLFQGGAIFKAKLGWQHEYGTALYNSLQGLLVNGNQKQGFRVQGPRYSRDSMDYGLYLQGALTKDFGIYMGFEGNMGAGVSSQSVFGGINYFW